jgi:hypothetical protein
MDMDREVKGEAVELSRLDVVECCRIARFSPLKYSTLAQTVCEAWPKLTMAFTCPGFLKGLEGHEGVLRYAIPTLVAQTEVEVGFIMASPGNLEIILAALAVLRYPLAVDPPDFEPAGKGLALPL